MMKRNTIKTLQKGSLMVEALALLGLITMVTPVMYKKAAERTTELQDINVATQMRTLNEALDSYVRNNFDAMKDKVPANDKIMIEAKDTSDEVVQGLKAYLPAGFDISNSKYFDAKNLKFAIERTIATDLSGKEHSTYTTAVLAPSINELKINRASKIASMIGINGGVFKGGKFEGTQGAWNANPSEWFGVDADSLKTGSLMTISSEVVSSSSQADTSKLLYRVDDGDATKNTMMTNLLMDNVGIEGITHLFGHGGNLYIGRSDGNEGDTNLIVRGTGEIRKMLTAIEGVKVETGGVTVQDGGVTVNNGGVDVVAGGLTVQDGGANITGDSIITGDLDVSGQTKTVGLQSSTPAGGNYAISSLGAMEVKGNLDIKGDETTGNVTIETGTLTVKEGNTYLKDTTVDGDLTITGALDAENLHARTQLTVGGEASEGSPHALEVNKSSFKFALGPDNYMSVNDVGFRAEFDNSGIAIDDGGTSLYGRGSNARGYVNVYNGEVSGYVESDAEDQLTSFSLDDKDFRIDTKAGGFFSGTSETTPYTSIFGPENKSRIRLQKDEIYMDIGQDYVAMDNESFVQGFRGYPVLKTTIESSTISSYNGGGGESYATFKKDSFEINKKSGDTVVAGINLDASDELGVKSKNFYLDNDGLALGWNLEASSGYRTIDSEDLGSENSGTKGDPKVIISRNGFIELAPPSSSKTDSGLESGYIKARRLVSDVKYEGDEMFHGYDSGGNSLITLEKDYRYKYYEVNPAYTSVMNDIKLATRGGARLSDILSDYVIKGIYVGDNTYHEGDGLHWDAIPIENGSVSKDALNEDNSSVDRTKCNDPEKPNECEIAVCEKLDCVASPWMGFVPRPQCPKGYQAVITSNPIRWRMSEVFYLKKDMAEEFGDGADVKSGSKYKEIITDKLSGAAINANDDPDNVTNRFVNYFGKHTNPRKGVFDIGVDIATNDNSGNHTHDTTIKPITIQTNTWLNSSVSPHENSDGHTDGWHVLMGFLYNQNDFGDLLKDIEEKPSEEMNIVWNLFPVYTQEMAAIATVYCSFNRHPIIGINKSDDDIYTYERTWRWGEGNTPVLPYDQLDPNHYRSGASYFDTKEKEYKNSFNRNPAKSDSVAAGDGDNWSNIVNDPTLPYKDAW